MIRITTFEEVDEYFLYFDLYVIVTISETQRNKKNGQTFCFANVVQNKSFLSIFCIASGAFIMQNMV